MIFRKPKADDLQVIYKILCQWNIPPYVDDLFKLIKEEINHKLDFNMQFFILEVDNSIVGVGGIADLIPEMRVFATGPADVNGDGILNIIDFVGFAKVYRHHCIDQIISTGCGSKDSNGDHYIDITDFIYFAKHYYTTGSCRRY